MAPPRREGPLHAGGAAQHVQLRIGAIEKIVLLCLVLPLFAKAVVFPVSVHGQTQVQATSILQFLLPLCADLTLVKAQARALPIMRSA